LFTLVLVVIGFMAWAVVGATAGITEPVVHIAYAWLFNVLIWAGLIAHIRADRAEGAREPSAAARIARPYTVAAAVMLAAGIIVPLARNWAAQTPLVIDLDTCTAPGNVSMLPRVMNQLGGRHTPPLALRDGRCSIFIRGRPCELPPSLERVTIKEKPALLFELWARNEFEYSFDVLSYCQTP
jgi:hypothetical protein